jgi:hypothetical protein
MLTVVNITVVLPRAILRSWVRESESEDAVGLMITFHLASCQSHDLESDRVPSSACLSSLVVGAWLAWEPKQNMICAGWRSHVYSYPLRYAGYQVVRSEPSRVEPSAPPLRWQRVAKWSNFGALVVGLTILLLTLLHILRCCTASSPTVIWAPTESSGIPHDVLTSNLKHSIEAQSDKRQCQSPYKKTTRAPILLRRFTSGYPSQQARYVQHYRSGQSPIAILKPS